MGRALMIGGVFLPSRDPGTLAERYRRYLELWEHRASSEQLTA